MKIDCMRSVVRDYMVREGFKEWSMGDIFDSHASISLPVMECAVHLNRAETGFAASALGLQESWVMLGTVDMEALIWLIDDRGWRQNITKVSGTECIEGFLRQFLLTGEELIAHRRLLEWRRLAEAEAADTLQRVDFEAKMQGLVHHAMHEGVQQWGTTKMQSMRKLLAHQMETLLHKAVHAYKLEDLNRGD